MPADHEAQSQVKEEEEAAAGVKALKGSLTQQKDGRKTRSDIAEFTIVGMSACKRQTRVYARLEDSQAVPDEPRDHAVAHVCQYMNLRVVLRCGVGEPETAKQSTISSKRQRQRPFLQPQKQRTERRQGSRTTPWQSIPVSFLGISRTSCGKQPHWRRTSDYAAAEYYTVALERPPVSHVAVNYHNRALEEHTKQRSRARSSAKVTRGGGRRLGDAKGDRNSECKEQPLRDRAGLQLAEEQCQQQADKK